jgi:hypothetical protein
VQITGLIGNYYCRGDGECLRQLIYVCYVLSHSEISENPEYFAGFKTNQRKFSLTSRIVNSDVIASPLLEMKKNKDYRVHCVW